LSGRGTVGQEYVREYVLHRSADIVLFSGVTTSVVPHVVYGIRDICTGIMSIYSACTPVYVGPAPCTPIAIGVHVQLVNIVGLGLL